MLGAFKRRLEVEKIERVGGILTPGDGKLLGVKSALGIGQTVLQPVQQLTQIGLRLSV
jgi:hypothetical protein